MACSRHMENREKRLGVSNRPVALAPVAALRAGGCRSVPARASVLAAHLRARKVVQALLHGVVVRLGHEERRRLLLLQHRSRLG